MEHCVPAEEGLPVQPEQGVPTDPLDESLERARSKPSRISENWWPNDQGQRLARELFGDSAGFETERFRDYWLAQQKAKLDWDAEWRVWARRQFDLRRGQQTFAFSFTGAPLKSQSHGDMNGRRSKTSKSKQWFDPRSAEDEERERKARPGGGAADLETGT